MASYGHSCSQQAPQGHTSMASYGYPSLPFASPLAANRHPRATHQWLLMGVQVCRLPALKPLKPSKRSKPSKPSKPLKTVKALKRWLGMLHPAANRHPKATHQWLLMGIQVCRLPALLQPTGTPGPYINGFSPRPRINGFLWASRSAVCQPSCSQQAPQGHTSMASPQGHTSMASYGHPSLPFASPLAANRHHRATHQWLLMGVQVCRLPALKPLKPSKRSKPSKRLKPSKPLKTVTPLKRWLGMLHPAANRHPKATHQWLLMGIQVCRLPALKSPNP